MDLISDEVLKRLAFVGVIFIAGLLGLIFWATFEWVKEKIRQARINYRIKHRFDGKPIAKCWCRDCRTHNNKTGLCSVYNMRKADNGFCDRADPIWKGLEEKNGKN